MLKIRKVKIKNMLLVLMLWPITIMSITFNYSFLIIPFISKIDLSNKKKINDISLFISFLLISWLFSVVFITHGFDLFRSFLSSISFILPFSLLFFKPIYNLDSIKKGVIIACTLYSLLVVYHMIFSLSIPFFYADGAKNMLRGFVPGWPQRFVVLIGIAIIFIIDGLKKKVRVLNVICLLLLLYAFFMSFTRTAYVSIILALLYYYSSYKINLSFKVLKYIFLILLVVGVIAVVDFLNNQIFFALFDRISTKFYEAFTAFDANSSERSISDRFDTWSEILSFTFTTNLLSGSGGIGASVLKDGLLLDVDKNSAHSQYFDILLRYGVLGIFFMYYFFRKVYKTASKEVRASLWFLLLYSFTNETIKLTYILLFFILLINLSYDSKTQRCEPKA